MFEGKAVREQGEKLVAMLETMVNGLGDIPVLKPLIDALARRHAHFDVVEGDERRNVCAEYKECYSLNAL